MKNILLFLAIAITLIIVLRVSCVRPLPSLNSKTYCDSIAAYSFELENRLNRYELTLELLKERNPASGAEFESIMSNETE